MQMLSAIQRSCLSLDVPLFKGLASHEQIELRKSQQDIETYGETGLDVSFVIEVLKINESLARQARCSSELCP